jgi:hypothetical protein
MSRSCIHNPGRVHTSRVRRITVVLSALVALAGAAAIGGSWAAADRDASAPRIALLDTDPASVRGTNFKSEERVRVVAAEVSETMTRVATASSAGAFTMRVPGVDPNACQGFSITATGNKGSRATFKRAPGQCPSLG